MKRTTRLSSIILTALCLGIAAIVQVGNRLPGPDLAQAQPRVAMAAAPAPGGSIFSALQQNATEPLSRLLMQFLVIVAATRLTGGLFQKFGQPAVVGEMVAGILLGPSLFGWAFPDAFHFVFAVESHDTLRLLSQVGVCLFMFAVGMELDVSHARRRADLAMVVSLAGIVLPFFLGVVLALLLYHSLAQAGATFTAFSLFMGISMSITAFPVLARILQERRLTRTDLGSMAITCAAIGDVTAWSILAFIVAVVRSSNVASIALNLALVIVFTAFMLLVIKPGLTRWFRTTRMENSEPGKGVLAAVLCLVIAASLATEIIGIHALFGAFMAGVVIPDPGELRQKLALRIENFSSVLLLPLFFVFAGLRTQIGLLSGWQDWLICAVIVAVATVGKLGGTALTARLIGMEWRAALQLGALMNTRGLMELIALNMGYDLGILSARIFTMLVIMAIVTTVMTGPLLSLFAGRDEGRPARPAT
jgi:Kef-type K+ transport system membrane component KefB